MNHSYFSDWNKFSKAMFPNALKLSFMNIRSALFDKDNPIITINFGYFAYSEEMNININSISRSIQNSAILAN